MNRLFLFLNNLAYTAMRRSEIVGAVFAMAIVFMLIIPLPLWLIDALIALNICLSALLIMLAMYLPKPLAFSSFPGVLLLTTMFRLALSISTTRQILIQQDAGEIVEAFGNFVVGGNLAVGLVIFLILTVVNFLVITKGSERVAEVAARFTLDAMPGKQMSIDSDLRSGLIDVNQARNRRNELAQESQLFGAMDGAMKFVKGDAIAGLVILFINLIGGISIGVLQLGMSAIDALHVYSILTIGDGLIAQIPALLISLTAGMIITRVASSDSDNTSNNVGSEIARQLTSQPKAWVLASVSMLCFAIMPGMPGFDFTVLAIAAFATGSIQIWRAKVETTKKRSDVDNEYIPPELNGKEDLRVFNASRPYLIQFPASERDSDSMQLLLEEIRKLRNRMVFQFGLTLPVFNVEFSELQKKDEFRFSIYEVPKIIASFNIKEVAIDVRWIDHMEAMPEGIVGEESRNEDGYIWIPGDHPILEDDDVERWTAQELILIRLKTALYMSSSNFIGLQETRKILNWLEGEESELCQELQRTMPITTIATVLQILASEHISLRSVRSIAEALVEHGQYERDVNNLCDMVRINLRSHICHQYAEQDGLHVWLLTQDSEDILRDTLRQTPNDVFFALEPEQFSAVRENLRDILFPIGKVKKIILVAQDLRRPLRRLIQEEFNQIPVLSFSELSPTVSINVLGRIDIGQYEAEE